MTIPVRDVLFEATIIGILNIAIYYLLRRISKKSTTTLLLFVAGFMIHILVHDKKDTVGVAVIEGIKA